MLHITEKNLHDTAEKQEGLPLELTLRVPVFEGEEESLCKKLGKFYEEPAHSFGQYCRKEMRKSRDRSLRNGEREAPAICAGLTSFPAYCDERVLSMITDVSFSDGTGTRKRRLIDNWYLPEGRLLGAGAVFRDCPAFRRACIGAICGKIGRRAGGFRYREDAERMAKRAFDPRRFYFTKRGFAFRYEPGVLWDAEEGEAVFVIPVDPAFLHRPFVNLYKNEGMPPPERYRTEKKTKFE